jgi:hypothetical protein
MKVTVARSGILLWAGARPDKLVCMVLKVFDPTV